MLSNVFGKLLNMKFSGIKKNLHKTKHCVKQELIYFPRGITLYTQQKGYILLKQSAWAKKKTFFPADLYILGIYN